MFSSACYSLEVKEVTKAKAKYNVKVQLLKSLKSSISILCSLKPHLLDILLNIFFIKYFLAPKFSPCSREIGNRNHLLVGGGGLTLQQQAVNTRSLCLPDVGFFFFFF